MVAAGLLHWEMATESNASSVLAKLMGIDRPSNLNTAHQRHKVLSQNYLQNIASVAKREKAFLYLDEVDSYMEESEDTADYLGGASVIDYQSLLCRTEKSFLARNSRSSSYSSSSDRKRKLSVSEGINGHFQGRKTSSCYNSLKYPTHGSLSSQEIAKQISGQVKHNIWHSCAELSSSRPRGEKNSENDEEKMTLSARLFDSEKKHEALSFNSADGSSSRESQTVRKQISERYRARKCSEEVRTSCGSSKIQDEVFVTSSNRRDSVLNISDGNFNTPLHTDTLNVCPVSAARYLSKPTRFPSAWVPRSRARQFTFDKSWCLRPGKWGIKQCNDSGEDNIGHKDVQSTSECNSLDSEKPGIHHAASTILNDSVELAEHKSHEETLTSINSVNNTAFSDLESPAYHEAHIILNEIKGRHREKVVSQNNTVTNCNLALETEGLSDDEHKRVNLSTEVRRENSSAKSTSCILLGDQESWKHQLKKKDKAAEPRSPVSSLEGPEGCMHIPNISVEAVGYLSDQVENDCQGLQRKLQLIETMSLESGSEGPEMVVSSEGGDYEDSVDLYQNDPQIMEVYQTLIKESLDFSYVVDVLVESGLQMMDLEIESKTWCLRGYVLEPFVFDELEKKFGKHMPWEKSERLLLFDRLNLGLLEIVKPSVGPSTWKKPVAKRFCQRQKSQDLIEEDLWSLLVNQQEVIKKKSDEVCKKEIEWLDLEEETDLIAQEIQSLLIDEFIEEFVSGEFCFC
ncbi:uncharacterized protein LOC110696662 [Chenopodium quinoa]|uniref:DUF4378 domain-containing protein n=1 Tax=Chenopodium quinoa TaxID=63459 RepID=A0A803M2T4_CHEQI|nr:uncharacterized protein LOC110696662 [Chenopodium quinoa]